MSHLPLGEQIRLARAERGWTQSALAAAASVSRPTVARIENGQDISASTLSKIASSLGLRLTLAPF